MTTPTAIYSAIGGGYLFSSASTYAAARAGSGSLGVGSLGVSYVGQNYTEPDPSVLETFLAFDVKPAKGAVLEAVMALDVAGEPTVTDFTIEVRAYDWGNSLTTADWVAGASLSSKTLLASISTADVATPTPGVPLRYRLANSGINLKNAVAEAQAGDGILRVIVVSSRTTAGNAPSALDVEYVLLGMLEDGIDYAPQLIITSVGGTPKATAYVHEGFWPYQRIAELTTAHDINRSFELMSPGQASLSIADNDPAITNDIIRRGNLLVITSPIAPPWAGPISLLSDTLEDGAIKVEAQGWAAVLTIRLTPLNELWLEGSSGAAFRSILSGLNSRGHTGLNAALFPAPGPAIRDLQLGGQDAAGALSDLHTRTGYEWWMDLDVSRSRAVATLNWGARQGLDKSNEIVLRDGVHFTKRSYALDVSKVRQSVTAVGGTGPISGRVAVTRGVASPGATLGTAFELLDQSLIESIDVPPMLRPEAILYQRSTADRATLSKQAQQSLEDTAGGAEKIAGSINETIPWTALGIGDYVTVITNTSGLGSVTRRARIVAMQPDEETGECDVVLEVPVR